ncbi:MAG: tRNA (adenosine(37)-N6)-threonylcarbamoyltransferase complex dimerization subunit type 1 TsaB [Bacteroidota bacterium]
MKQTFLAIESATDIGSVAVYEEQKLLGSIEIRKAKSHARLLTPMIQQLLKDLQLAPADLSAIAVGKGPGSYTGLRVGVSTAKGLCMALDKPLLSFGSLEALAWQSKSLASELEAWICPMIDARRMEVYAAFYDAEIQAQTEIKAEILEEGVFDSFFEERRIIFLGNGAPKSRAVLGSHPNAIILDDVSSSATAVGELLWQKWQDEAFEDLISFEPFYLKDFVATKSKKWVVRKKRSAKPQTSEK